MLCSQLNSSEPHILALLAQAGITGSIEQTMGRRFVFSMDDSKIAGAIINLQVASNEGPLRLEISNKTFQRQSVVGIERVSGTLTDGNWVLVLSGYKGAAETKLAGKLELY